MKKSIKTLVLKMDRLRTLWNNFKNKLREQSESSITPVEAYLHEMNDHLENIAETLESIDSRLESIDDMLEEYSIKPLTLDR